jgi:Arc/MetJ family transcription regulator
MRTSLRIDEALLRRALELSGLTDATAVVRAGLEALVTRESARLLAELGGTEPRVQPILRRRPVRPRSG